MKTLEKVISLELNDLSGGGECGLYNYGYMNDLLHSISLEFHPGNIYGIIGEFGDGGWALSYILSGKTKWDSGTILINNKTVPNNVMYNYACSLGNDISLRSLFGLKRMSVREQIEYGINKGLSFCNNVDIIKQKFGLSDERFNREIKYFSGERWKASMAIGFANGKTIYCFPWMNSKLLMQLNEHIKLCLKTLLEVGAIVIIPTTFKETLLDISEYCNFVYLSQNNN